MKGNPPFPPYQGGQQAERVDPSPDKGRPGVVSIGLYLIMQLK